ncbi:MAG: asparaginase [Planctomycetota bacterium]
MAVPSTLLAVTTRSDRVESEHYGQIAVSDAKGQLLVSFGDPSIPTYMRSSAKPFQAVTAVRLGVADQYHWTDEELAIVCASHAAEAGHLVLVRSILAKAGLSPSDLRCGPHPPMNSEEKEWLDRSGGFPQKIHNNCSGKHAGMLAGCMAMGWPKESYLAKEHPWQKENLRSIARFSGIEASSILTGTDGCGVPSFFLSVQAMATAFARLANPSLLDEPEAGAAGRVYRAMTSQPRTIAGRGKFNTQLAAFLGDRAVAKSGAEGVFCLGLRQPALGIAIKISDGNSRVHPTIVCRLLEEFLPEYPWSDFLPKVDRPIVNTLDEPVGRIVAAI